MQVVLSPLPIVVTTGDSKKVTECNYCPNVAGGAVNSFSDTKYAHPMCAYRPYCDKHFAVAREGVTELAFRTELRLHTKASTTTTWTFHGLIQAGG